MPSLDGSQGNASCLMAAACCQFLWLTEIKSGCKESSRKWCLCCSALDYRCSCTVVLTQWLSAIPSACVRIYFDNMQRLWLCAMSAMIGANGIAIVICKQSYACTVRRACNCRHIQLRGACHCRHKCSSYTARTLELFVILVQLSAFWPHTVQCRFGIAAFFARFPKCGP